MEAGPYGHEIALAAIEYCKTYADFPEVERYVRVAERTEQREQF